MGYQYVYMPLANSLMLTIRSDCYENWGFMNVPRGTGIQTTDGTPCVSYKPKRIREIIDKLLTYMG
jgi:hypothetical protein